MTFVIRRCLFMTSFAVALMFILAKGLPMILG